MMNATPTPSPTAALVQGSAPSRKGESNATDTPFGQILSSEIALLSPDDAQPSRQPKSLADRLKELLDTPSDVTQAADAGRVPGAPVDPGIPATTAPDVDTLLATGFSLVSPTQDLPAEADEADADATPLMQDAGIPFVLASVAQPGAGTPTGEVKASGDMTPENIAMGANTGHDQNPEAHPVATRSAAPTAHPDAVSMTSAAVFATAPATISATTPTAAGTLAAPTEKDVLAGLSSSRPAVDGARMPEVPPELASTPVSRPVAPPTAADTGPTPALAAMPRLAPEVGSSAWNQALGERIVWMASGKQQTASLTLNPPHLGPLQVVLNVTSDQATANFFAAQPEVRHAIEAALPRLREMMNEAGIQLGQASVSADTPSQNQASEQQVVRASSHESGEYIEADAQPTAQPAPRVMRGLVDTFA